MTCWLNNALARLCLGRLKESHSCCGGRKVWGSRMTHAGLTGVFVRRTESSLCAHTWTCKLAKLTSPFLLKSCCFHGSVWGCASFFNVKVIGFLFVCLFVFYLQPEKNKESLCMFSFLSKIMWNSWGERCWSTVKQASHALRQSAWPTSWGRSSCGWMQLLTSSSSAGTSFRPTSVSWVSSYSLNRRFCAPPRPKRSHRNQPHLVPLSRPPSLLVTLPPHSAPKTLSRRCSPSLPLACSPRSTTSSSWAQ